MSHLLQFFQVAADTAQNPYKINPNDVGVPTTTTSIGQGIAKVIQLALVLIGMLSVVMVIVGGLLMVLSSGNPARFKQGREAVIYAVVGVAIAIVAYAIVAYLAHVLGS